MMAVTENTHCAICKKRILSHHKMVRVVVELVSKGKRDGSDPQYWTTVDDWELETAMHLTCARNGLESGDEIPYGMEVQDLDLDSFEEGIGAPELQVVS